MQLIALFTRHPNAANLLMALMLIIGIFAIPNLTTRFWPPSSLQQVEVRITWPGASAEDVSDSILDAVEPAVRFLPNVEKVFSYAREGSAFTNIDFDPGTDMQTALGDVEQAIAALTTLPEGSETPRINTDSLRDPVAKVGISGPFSEEALQVFARRIRDDLLSRGLEKVELRGVREREILVEAREIDLVRLDLTVEEIATAIRNNTLDRPSGVLDGAVDRQIRVVGTRETADAVRNVEVKVLPNGDVLRVGDVADVREGFARSAVNGLRNGNPAVEMSIERAQSADALETDAIVRTYIDEMRTVLPRSLNLELYDVRTEKLWDRVSLLLRNGWQGLAVVLVVLFLFLEARIAFWVALGIPVAFAGTLGVMLITGQTINMLSLFALIMMLGVIVDDAIVVGEHAATLSERGVPPVEAAARGAQEMFVPVAASSITTIAAFAPIFLMRDVIGQFMQALPLVAIAIIIASILECFLVLPGHLAHAAVHKPKLLWGRFLRLTIYAGVGAAFIGGLISLARRADPDALRAVFDLPPSLLVVAAILGGLALAGLLERRRAKRANEPAMTPLGTFRRAFDRRFNALRDGPYTRIVKATYDYRYTTVAVSVGLFLIVVQGLYLGGGHIKFVFFPTPEAEFVTARVEFQPGTPRTAVIAGIEEVEAALERAAVDLGGERDSVVNDAYALIGRAGRNRGDNLATLQVQLVATEDRDVRTPALVRAWSDAVPELAGLKSISIERRRGGPPGRDVDLVLTGASPAVLKAAANDAAAAITALAGINGVSDDLPLGKPEFALSITPRGAALGFTLENVGAQVQGAFEGTIARRIADGDDEIPIRVRLRSNGEAVPLHELFLRTPNGQFVSITEIVSIAERDTFSTIVRRDGVTNISVAADVDTDITTPQLVTEQIRTQILPVIEGQYGVRGHFEGRDRERRRSFQDLREGAYLALAVIFITLAFVFGSYWRPIVIMLIIPFGAVGAIGGHALIGLNLSITSFVGLLGLTGILVNDSIILMRRFDERLRAGEHARAAAVGASADRLRAVLLTSLTTIGGLLPLMFETSQTAQFLMPMATTIVFGLSIATALVLILVPALTGIAFDIGRIVSILIGKVPAGRVQGKP